MKLKCNHERRVMVLPSGNTVHRSDGTGCSGKLTIGGKAVTKMVSPDTKKFVTLGVGPNTPEENLLSAIFEKGAAKAQKSDRDRQIYAEDEGSE